MILRLSQLKLKTSSHNYLVTIIVSRNLKFKTESPVLRITDLGVAFSGSLITI